jgi:iron complex outermembrane recepter protein
MTTSARPFVVALLAIAVAIRTALPAAGDEGAARAGLAELSLQELMDVEVTSVLRKPERRSLSAAAVYVLTSDDMRKAGVVTIPDALRLVPGVESGEDRR